ncbi:DUF188 domain-containing protein [Irregularibacter muris]|uniref:DUF188 domain-containing protein n=1 Tax=Irregularibacter muris TaxID=1796619 RepID=A0AAE3L394_9FIRM|nr:DUF188 domain-containing protein [Irregularibacter muris]MCR1897873.1 DUF188 domain-containing protein [Irregularibacter muris]
MKILIDGDACPVKKEIAEIGLKYNIQTFYFCSLSHYSDYSIFSKWILVDNEDQAVDMAILNKICSGDILITQDYGLASLALNKKAYVLSNSGKRFTENNIDHYLLQRYLSLQQRKMKVKTTKQRKRTKEEDVDFKRSLEKLIHIIIKDPQQRKN